MLSADGRAAGRPGVAITVSGTGYAGCNRVYFFFDGRRLGTDSPDASGFVGAMGLSVPGDASVGEHRVTSSCSSAGGPVQASRTFVVKEADIHRSLLATSLTRPDQVSLDLEHVLASALVAVGILLLFAFPGKLFNSTVEENYDEIRGRFRMPARAVDGVSAASRSGTFMICTLVAAVVLGFLSLGFGLNVNSLVLVAGFTVDLIVMSAGFSLPAAIAIHHRTGEWGKVNFLPGSLLVSVVLVGLSRLLDYQPGYFYGSMAGLAFASALPARDVGRITAANWTWALILSTGAWFANMPVSAAAARPDARWVSIGLEACLVLIFLWGIESLAVAMLPMRFLDGGRVINRNRQVWALLMFLGVFATVHILLSPNRGYVGQTTEQLAVGVLTLFSIFGAVSVVLWAYFQYPPHLHGQRLGHRQRAGDQLKRGAKETVALA